eukprot:CAMPEP_0118952142 /NCGR_PEP_ID=MMETSP1169-20130426/54342_1 /TAXON_ID=36882 /ORGANISM="Pyramimonas obovata, Strain CCMP722" /LENGTH=103 /DNA_ID=CAMNT_0006899319 /DNA_START=158 /DNA_END=465 /DNA_ORIENTATION=+
MSAPKAIGEWQHPSVEAALNAQARTQSALSRWGMAMLMLAVAAGLVFFKGDGLGENLQGSSDSPMGLPEALALCCCVASFFLYPWKGQASSPARAAGAPGGKG